MSSLNKDKPNYQEKSRAKQKRVARSSKARDKRKINEDRKEEKWN